jgi:TM2 domain-containing membrane protein YozV
VAWELVIRALTLGSNVGLPTYWLALWSSYLKFLVFSNKNGITIIIYPSNRITMRIESR